jgi:hypothetical protein
MHRRTATAALAALALAPATAHADTIVFRRGGDIWIMKPDGTRQRRVAQGAHAWPSATDDGTIAAVDAAGAIHRLTQAGVEIGAPLPTAATQATPDTPAEPPTHVRISPDGRFHVATPCSGKDPADRRRRRVGAVLEPGGRLRAGPGAHLELVVSAPGAKPVSRALRAR